MARTTPHEALIYLMVITSASDREMTDVELQRIGQVVTTWPVFADFDAEQLLATAQKCQRLLAEEDGLEGVLTRARGALPARLADTAYAAAVEVATADMEMRLEEAAIMEAVRERLGLDEQTATAIERAAKARHRSLT